MTVLSRAELEIAASSSFIQAGAPGRFATLGRHVSLGPGATAFLAELVSDEGKEVLVINRAGQLSVHRAEDFGAVGAPRNRSPFLALAGNGARAIVAVRSGSFPAEAIRIFSVGPAQAPQVIADASDFVRSVGASNRIVDLAARDGVVVLVVINAIIRPGIPVGTRVGLYHNGTFSTVASGSGGGSIIGFGESAANGTPIIYFSGVAPGSSVHRWDSNGVTPVLEARPVVEDMAATVGSARAAIDGGIAVLDTSGRRLLSWQAGRFTVLVRNEATATDGTLVRFTTFNTAPQVLRVDGTHVYFTGVRSVTFPSGSTVDQADVLFRVPRTGGAIETVFDPRRVFTDLSRVSLSGFTLAGDAPELTFLVRENAGSQQAIFRGTSPIGPTDLPAVPPGFPRIRLEDRGTGYAYRGGQSVDLAVEVLSAGDVTYQWGHDGVPISEDSRRYTGIAGPRLALFPFAQSYHRGTHTVAVSNAAGTTFASSWVDVMAIIDDGVGTLPPMGNFSVRGYAGGGEGALIAGFALLPPLLSIGGNPLPFRHYQAGTSQRLLIRAVGPGLAPFIGAESSAAATQLSLFSGDTRLATNDGAWSATPDVAAVAATAGAFPLMPDSRDSALLLTLAPGNYTARIAAPAGEGTALVECYVVGGSGTVRNLSARAFVSDREPHTLTLGFVIQQQPGSLSARAVLLRAVGAGLTRFGVSAPARRPVLELYGGMTLLAENHGERAPNFTDIRSAAAEYGAFELEENGTDAALLLILPPGVYTARVRASPGDAGVVLAELYTPVGF